MTIVVGGALTLTLGPEAARGTFVGLLLAAAVLWAVGAWLFALIREPAGAIGALAAVLATGLLIAGWESEAAYAAVVFVAVGAQEGVRLGRKAYLVTAAPPDERPLYVALANTIIGVVMIALALLGVVAEVAGVPAAVAAVLALSLLGVVATRWTPEPEQMADA